VRSRSAWTSTAIDVSIEVAVLLTSPMSLAVLCWPLLSCWSGIVPVALASESSPSSEPWFCGLTVVPAGTVLSLAE
jgi:hypothetical protein